MSIEGKVLVNAHYTRSVNIERDADSLSVVKAYIPTTRAMQTLKNMAAALKAEESPRAWSLVGPYGSGKSSFAVFLAHLLGSSDNPATRAALKTIQGTKQPGLAPNINALTHDSSGYCAILLTGSPESFGRRLIQSLAEKAQEIWSRRRGSTPGFVQDLQNLAEQKEQPTTSDILGAIEKLQDKLAIAGYSGLLIIVDELGKFLEYEARHYGANDIFLLQALAEHAVAAHQVKLSLVVMLHQAFDQYARGLGESLKNEWAKVQGRFENIPFLESAEQTLRIVGSAIHQEFSQTENEKIQKSAKRMAKILFNAKAIPGTMDEETASDLFASCYPLHPVSALILPILCQKVAQNERTLFSFLGSREHYGFQDAINRIEKVGDWINPWEIYEYFILNQSSSLTDHITHRRWAEVVTAVERLGDADDKEHQLLKAIGLLNIIGTQGGLKASKAVVGLCLPRKADTLPVLAQLQSKSILQYRKFSSEYRVWEGSDFDLDAAVLNERERISRINLADALNKRHSLLPIVARKYTIQNGVIRYFVPTFVDSSNFRQETPKIESTRILFYLAQNKNDEMLFHSEVAQFYSNNDIVVLCLNGEQMRESALEVLALENIQIQTQELSSDPVAKREYRERYNDATLREEELLTELTSKPGLNQWYWTGKPLAVGSKRSLQEAFSEVLQKIYYKSPVFLNELINREKPSAQASAAKNKLAAAMFRDEENEGLGIDKFPPEKSIYLALLKESKLHSLGKNNKWCFRGPISKSKTDDPCKVSAVWQRIEEFLDTTEQEAKSLIEINKELLAPPYGVKAGILPILYLTTLLAHKQELAIYEGKTYTPHLTEEQIERFLKRPDEFTVQRFRITGMNESVHKAYSNTLFNDGKQRSLLELASPIAKMVLALPVYTQKTKKGLSESSQAIRTVTKLSKSPIKLMLEEIPDALGIDRALLEVSDEEVKRLSIRLIDSLRELKYCLPNLKEEFKGFLSQAFGLDNEIDLSDLRISVASRCKGLEDYTIDRDGLKVFIQRAINRRGDDNKWLNDILCFLGSKPPEKWSDLERDSAEFRLIEFTQKLNELEKLRLHYQKPSSTTDENVDIYLLRSIKKGCEDYDEVVAVDSRRHEAVKDVKKLIKGNLSKVASEDLQLVVLAEIVDEYLAKQKSNRKKRNTTKPTVKKLEGVKSQ
jgi:hypothetical protein